MYQTRQTDALPAQKLRLDAYSNRLKLNSEYFAFDETAYKEDRQKFRVDCRQHQKYPNFCIVVFDKIDRFTKRRFKRHSSNNERLGQRRKNWTTLPSDNLIYHKNSPASDKTRLGMGMVFGEYYSSAISDNVKRRQNRRYTMASFLAKHLSATRISTSQMTMAISSRKILCLTSS